MPFSKWNITPSFNQAKIQKEYRPEFDIIWVSRQFLRRLVKAEFCVAENESDSAPFSTHRRDAPTPFALLLANRYPALV